MKFEGVLKLARDNLYAGTFFCLLKRVCLGGALKATAYPIDVEGPRILLVVNKSLQGKEVFLWSEINYFSLMTLAAEQ